MFGTNETPYLLNLSGSYIGGNVDIFHCHSSKLNYPYLEIITLYE